ncbi:MAG: hypothetical protein AAF577_05320 [Pseudomonadota bacterium]
MAAEPIVAACRRVATPPMLEDIVTMIGPSEGCVGPAAADGARCATPRRWRGDIGIEVTVSQSAAAPQAHVMATAERFALDMAAATGRAVRVSARPPGAAPTADAPSATEPRAVIRLIVGIDAAQSLMAPRGVLHGFNPRAFGAKRVHCIAITRSRAGALLAATVLIAGDVEGGLLDRCLLEELYNSTGLRADPRGAAALLDVYPAVERDGLPAMSEDHAAMLRLYYAVPVEALTTPVAVGAAIADLCLANR